MEICNVGIDVDLGVVLICYGLYKTVADPCNKFSKVAKSDCIISHLCIMCGVCAFL